MRNTFLQTCLTLFIGVSAGQAAIVSFNSPLLPEAPGATGSGAVTLTFDTVAQTLAISTFWSGLSGVTSVAHIHCCTAVPFTGTVGVAVTPGTLPGFPVGLAEGNYDTVINMANLASYTAAFRGADTAAMASARLLQAMEDGNAYFNVHSSTFPGGEIRGFPQPTPEPATFVLAGLALAGLSVARRRG